MNKYLLSLIGMVFLGQVAIAQQKDEKAEITKTVTLYFEGMVERNKAKLEEAFIQEARLIGYRGRISRFLLSKAGPKEPQKELPEIQRILSIKSFPPEFREILELQKRSCSGPECIITIS